MSKWSMVASNRGYRQIMQRSHHSLREIQNFGMFAMRHLGKLEVKRMTIIMDLRGEWAVDQAEDFAGL
jgi:hypothetical protein